MRPTNPIGPAIAVAAPHSTHGAERRRRAACGTTFSPSPAARSSPSASEFMPRAQSEDETSAPTASNGATSAIRSQIAPPTPPICQNRKVSAIRSTRGAGRRSRAT